MDYFKREFDKEKALNIIQKVLIGIGSPDLEDECNLLGKSGLTNIKLERDDRLNSLDSILDKATADYLRSISGVKLNFTYKDNDYSAELKLGDFIVTKTTKGKTADCYKTADFNLQYTITDDEEKDKQEIEKLIKQGLEINVDELNGEEESTYNDTVMSIRYNGAFCEDRELAYTLFDFLSKQLGLIRVSEASFINELFMLNNTPVLVEKVEQTMRLEFDQTFDILKAHGHDKDNQVESNDMENYIFYVEKDNIQGCVYQSQNTLFLVAKNNTTGVIKAWNTLRVIDDWFDFVSDSYIPNDEGQEVFDVAVFLQEYVKAKYGNSYDYPFEFDTAGYRKSIESLMDNFEEDEELIYDSERGFMPSKFMYFNSLLMEINYSIDLLTEEYGVEKELLVLTEQDINTPDYFMRSMQKFSRAFSTNRASMLYYLFLCIGNGIFWNGKTFTTGETFNGDYEETEGMKDYSPLGYTNSIRLMGISSYKLFNLPDNMSDEWKKAVFELCFYIKEWIEYSESEKNEFDYGADEDIKDRINLMYEKYYNQVVVDSILKARAS